MTQKQIDTAKGYLASGYDLNQVAAIMMIGRNVIEQSLVEKPKKTKKVTNGEDL